MTSASPPGSEVLAKRVKNVRGNRSWLAVTLAISLFWSISAIGGAVSPMTLVTSLIVNGVGNVVVCYVVSFLLFNWVKREWVNPGTLAFFIVLVVIPWLLV